MVTLLDILALTVSVPYALGVAAMAGGYPVVTHTGDDQATLPLRWVTRTR